MSSKRRLGPLQVVEHDDEPRRRASAREQPAHRPGDSSGRCARSPSPISDATSAATAAASPASSAPSLARAASAGSSRRMPAAARTTSASGQNVPPSP